MLALLKAVILTTSMDNSTLRKAQLLRYESTQQGTFGALLVDGKFFCYVGELPWRDNTRNLSCIPAGTYRCELTESPRFGTVYEVKKVPGRNHILFHAGNFVGDRTAGLLAESDGCLLPGSAQGEMGSQQAVWNSRFTLQSFMEEMAGEPFDLTIKDSYE